MATGFIVIRKNNITDSEIDDLRVIVGLNRMVCFKSKNFQ